MLSFYFKNRGQEAYPKTRLIQSCIQALYSVVGPLAYAAPYTTFAS